MIFPGALQLQRLPCLNVGKTPHDRDQFAGSGCLEAGDRVTRLFGVIGQPLDHALHRLHRRSLIGSRLLVRRSQLAFSNSSGHLYYRLATLSDRIIKQPHSDNTQTRELERVEGLQVEDWEIEG